MTTVIRRRPGKPWAGHDVAKAREWMMRHHPLPQPCGLCNRPVNRGDAWVIGHIKSRGERPDLTWEPSNWRIEHRKCSDRTGQAGVIAKAKAEALSGFPRQLSSAEPPPLSISLPEPSTPVQTRADLSWSHFVQSAPAWIQPYLQVPEDAAPPALISPVPAEAVGSYGPEVVEWIEQTENIRLRWWQVFSLVLQHAYREDGSLVFREIIESTPRRAGKSRKLRGLILWRMEHGADLFGENQTIIHTGSDVAICREVQRGSWRWAEGVAGWRVTRANGKEAIETPDGDRWLVRAQDAVYGYDGCLVVGDECWNVRPETVSEGLERATLERQSPQLHLTSTAHSRPTSLMPNRMAAAADDPSSLLMVWAAPDDADPGDPEAWRAASPFWSADREALIRRKYSAALAGQIDPEVDDLDPMAGFAAHYLNRWPKTRGPRQVAGDPVTSADTWSALETEVPDREPDAVAVESWFSEGVSVAKAWKTGNGDLSPVVVSVDDYPTVEAAAREIKNLQASRAFVGQSLAEDPAWKRNRVRVEPMRTPTRTAVADLSRLLSEDAIRHAASPFLTEQVLEVRTVPGTDGPRLKSTGRADAIKASVWAANAARTRKASGSMRILLPST